ncbi:MAG TPA: metallophosphoesterase [Gemmatimonadaceae bacterium]|nr:metallophosphoesterase [Gemmatimonadaceae bacterium]
MTSVLHLSDLHFGTPAVPEQVEAIEVIIQEEQFDVVAISGDLSQRSRAGEFLRARAFIRDAKRVSQTIVVPGNHDVKWWRSPLGVGNSRVLYENYRAYISPELQPVLRVPGATFVGLNTAHGVTRHTLTWDPHDIGVIGDLRRRQIAHAREVFDAAPPSDVRVVVMHHNPMKGEISGRHGLVNTRRVLGAFADLGVDLVLCGHDHQEAIHYVEHTRRGTVISTAGTLSSRSRGGRPSSLNVIAVTEGTIEIATRIWTPGQHTFVRGPVRSFQR